MKGGEEPRAALLLSVLAVGLMFDPAGFLRMTLACSAAHEAGHALAFRLCAGRWPHVRVGGGRRGAGRRAGLVPRPAHRRLVRGAGRQFSSDGRAAAARRAKGELRRVFPRGGQSVRGAVQFAAAGRAGRRAIDRDMACPRAPAARGRAHSACWWGLRESRGVAGCAALPLPSAAKCAALLAPVYLLVQQHGAGGLQNCRKIRYNIALMTCAAPFCAASGKKRKDVSMHESLKAALAAVQKPGRYTGGEPGCVYKDKSALSLRFAFCFPDTYEVGMSFLGMKILYEILNDRPDIWCERCFMPWVDMKSEMEKARYPAVCAREQGCAARFRRDRLYAAIRALLYEYPGDARPRRRAAALRRARRGCAHRRGGRAVRLQRRAAGRFHRPVHAGRGRSAAAAGVRRHHRRAQKRPFRAEILRGCAADRGRLRAFALHRAVRGRRARPLDRRARRRARRGA